jgi:chemotaxis protein MotA
MNFSFILGVFVAFGVFLGAIFTATNNTSVFLNGHAFLIVIGGTVAAALISFPIGDLLKIQVIIFRKMVGKYGVSPQDLIVEIVKLATGQKDDSNYLKDNASRIEYPFLREAVLLLVDGGLGADKMDSLLKKRAEVIFLKYEGEAQIFRSIARFPPAFGLLGAVIGMITLLQGLGSPDSFKQIGPAMAMAMVATMYGIAIANFVLLPIAENLSKLNKEEFINRNIVIDGIKLLREQDHPLLVEESLNSYLMPSERSKANKRSA